MLLFSFHECKRESNQNKKFLRQKQKQKCVNLSDCILDGEGGVVVLVLDGDALVVLDGGFVSDPPGLVGDGLADDVDGPGVGPADLDGRGSQVVANKSRFD